MEIKGYAILKNGVNNTLVLVMGEELNFNGVKKVLVQLIEENKFEFVPVDSLQFGDFLELLTNLESTSEAI